uniref:Uncharacterized protein LOC102801682 n=1 Tax=Saccoglossus kowalevskii TaxID=10224 RepID=A0ABM0MQ07_SACKO|nr:PREDICTED: uncharacterized protein LOC102801682 [Saccoglossus kowalevskii]
MWLKGPQLLWQPDHTPETNNGQQTYDISDEDPEVRNKSCVFATDIKKRKPSPDNPSGHLGSKRFLRFSSWTSLRRAVANLILKIQSYKTNCKEVTDVRLTPKILERAENHILRTVQKDAFPKELKKLSPTDTGGNELRKDSPLYRLNTFMDEDQLLRVGGRIRRADLELSSCHPIVLPKNNHISQLIVEHVHQETQHQGRHLTLAAVRAKGYWILGLYNLVRSILHKCTTCRILRAKPLTQVMADLPADGMANTPPFTNVGMDVIGPWNIVSRRTRGGASGVKRWAVIFVCLYTTAIHIEIIDSMDTSAFINALRRFMAIRGPVKRLRCDQGTNFIGAKNELNAAIKELNQKQIQKFLTYHKCEWILNPPHASHFGGTVRRILESMHVQLGRPQFTHDTLTTLMAEVCAVVNAKPITTIPSDANDPQALSPDMILTMKPHSLPPPPGDFVQQDLYSRKQWRRTQYLADQFWIRWRKEFLQIRQTRRKWNETTLNIKEGDIVLLRDKEHCRNNWPLARIIKVYPSDDNLVRKADVMVCRDNTRRVYQRPISELVLIQRNNKMDI